MKKMIILASLLAAISAFGAGESDNIIKAASYGKKVVEENSINQNNKNAVADEYYRKEAIYNLFLSYSAQNEKDMLPIKKASLINIIDENLTVATNKNITNEDSNITIIGYCLIKNDIFVGKQPAAGHFLCNTNIGQIELFGNLRPINDIATLAYDPIHMEYKEWRYQVISAKILNSDKTSYNIATYVNDRKISEIALTATIDGTETIKTQSNDYIKQVEASRKKNTTEYIQVGSGSNTYVAPVQNQNTEKPIASDYITKGLIDITAGIVKNTAEIFKKDLPYLYLIKGGSQIWIDIKVSKNGEKI
ncbi:hypothetical protein CFT12S00416_07960 [Campylobacter fetus subsp. testudinum]|uniref:hypothetical protein n=1 Tax=Campylobacter fetus TaxID=196 RepID=UPI0008187DE5|nr:hypothetical protein [Campylobacter fetus]OCR87752.1 hypothetical protein CFT12S00416_07960 [Campylobacter fetus subsp. testudinum]OCR99078.1 hypothetical protein A9K75_08505 [Campylobacter fetus subsp. testudinum]